MASGDPICDVLVGFFLRQISLSFSFRSIYSDTGVSATFPGFDTFTVASGYQFTDISSPGMDAGIFVWGVMGR